MPLSRTLTKEKGSSNNVENPFLVSYKFLQDVPQKNCKSSFRCNLALLLLVFCYCISSPTNCDRRQNCSIFILKNPPWNFFSSVSRSGYKWLNISKSGLFMFIGRTHMFHLLRRHLLLHIIACKTSRLKQPAARIPPQTNLTLTPTHSNPRTIQPMWQFNNTVANS